MTAQDEHSAQKRRQIIAGAEIVFGTDGYEGASMARIAAQATVSKGTLYNYFASKSDLFAAFVSQKAFTDLPTLFSPIGEGRIELVLNQVATGLIGLMLSPSALLLYRIVMSEAAKFPHLAHIYWTTGPERALGLMTCWVDTQMQAGRLRQDDPAFAAGQFFALCQMPACMKRRLQLVPELAVGDVDQIVQGAVRVFLDSYAIRSAPLARSSEES
jgi:TetR/AcrR family transcriptional repressor of mexJK operon